MLHKSVIPLNRKLILFQSHKYRSLCGFCMYCIATYSKNGTNTSANIIILLQSYVNSYCYRMYDVYILFKLNVGNVIYILYIWLFPVPTYIHICMKNLLKKLYLISTHRYICVHMRYLITFLCFVMYLFCSPVLYTYIRLHLCEVHKIQTHTPLCLFNVDNEC